MEKLEKIVKPMVSDLVEARKEGEITRDWFTNIFTMLDDLGELGFNTTILYQQLREAYTIVYPEDVNSQTS